ncbi:hypothetical protein H0X10_02040 [Candidatus Saccharibacteria bacterium]|nr:hypothetical protein [Candidatus Saccharibacteria bacterium]
MSFESNPMNQLRKAIEQEFDSEEVTQMRLFGLNPDIDSDWEKWEQTTPHDNSQETDYS